ncbi:hypothetical protein PIB30_072936 [Stylosanthes scabra]|uniref:Uncharacterized protein n=1 Tax=Stylosanthes scabra TaxID=79078 RepID=A0ABU6QPA5_9FABA|nr:hypothetical protein [Stylosanthes scabra]
MINYLRWQANFLQLLLDDRRFVEYNNTKKPLVSKFNFIEAETPQQHMDSNDGGVWVAKRMQLSYMWDGYLDKVDEKTRMSLALELVMGKHNRKAEQVGEMATSIWDKIIYWAVSTEKRKRKKREDKETSHSPSISF